MLAIEPSFIRQNQRRPSDQPHVKRCQSLWLYHILSSLPLDISDPSNYYDGYPVLHYRPFLLCWISRPDSLRTFPEYYLHSFLHFSNDDKTKCHYCACSFLFTFAVGWMSGKFSKMRLETAKRTDNRVQATNELVSGMKTIKLFNWELPFCKLIESYRRLRFLNFNTFQYWRRNFLLQNRGRNC